MQNLVQSKSLLIILGCLVLAGTGCTPAQKKARHMSAADRSYQEGKYDQAEIEYRNVLQIEQLNPAALGRLGLIYFDQGSPLRARPFLLKANELQPGNLEVLAKLGLLDLALRNLPAARAKALAILDQTPALPEAPLLLAEASVTPKHVAEARQRLKQLPPAVAASAPVLTALGLLELRERNIYTAEATFKRAVALDPKLPEVHSALAVIAQARKNLPLAEQEFKRAADYSPARSSKKIQYAQFKIQMGDAPAARALLEQMTQSTPDFLPAWTLLAEQTAEDKKYDEALAMVKKVLTRDALYPDALLLSARLHLAKGEFTTAVSELEKALKVFPASPQFLYQMGAAYVAAGEITKAMESLRQALLRQPSYTEAALLLSNLNLRTGNPSAAVTILKAVVQQHPELIQPRLLLADAFLAGKNPDDALAVFAAIDRDFPGNPRTPLLKGLVLLQQGNRPAARQAFSQSLQRAPGFPAAVEQLVNLDLADKEYAAAHRQVADMIAKQPKAPEGYILQARIFSAENDMGQAETSLQQAINLQPQDPTAYFMLAALYTAGHQEQKAVDNLQLILAKNPRDTKALLMTGVLDEQLKKYDAALAAYEQLLAIDPKSAPALNNAAYLYSERFNQLDKAFAAAQKARELFPHEPHLADTLGWILVKKHQYPWALNLLQESAEKLPTSAEIQYHVGVAHYQMGEEEPAKLALEKALQLKQEFPGLEDAKNRLALLQLETGKAGASDRKVVEAALAARPDDPIALARLAAIHEHEGKPDKAIEAYQSALKASPANVPVMLNLVRVYSAQKDTAKALELAKAARKLAPDDTAVTFALGRLAYQTRDFPWAFSLLQEATRQQPDDADGLRDMAKAAYSVGRVTEAVEALNQALKLDEKSPAASEARTMLDLIGLADNPAQATAAKARIVALLQANPANVPALMAAATASEATPAPAAAITTYQKILEQFPGFTPAMRRLAILYAASAGDNPQAYDLALKARTAYSADAQVAKALGILTYRKGDFSRAAALLTESSAALATDAEVFYYLGQSQVQAKDLPGGRQSLQKALDLGLRADLAAAARKALAAAK